jgi:glycerophosphoryl diester phosphodiesterase
MTPLLIAHRGDAVNFAENTIDAFRSAFEHGADGIELDVQFYQGKLIVVHDYLFDRNRDYPKLSDVLATFVGKGRIEIEVKQMDWDFLPELKRLIGKYKDADIEITTSVWPLAQHLRVAFPATNMGIIFLSKEFEDWMTEDFICTKIIKLTKLMQGNVAHIQWDAIKKAPKVVKVCHDNEIKVHSHIFKQEIGLEAEIYNRMCVLGIDQCTFDDIALVPKVRG